MLVSTAHNPSSTKPERLIAPATGALALAAEVLGVGPRRPGRRAMLTSTGLVAIDVVDRFTELAVELHWRVIAEALAGDGLDRLGEFRELQLEGYQLAFALDQIPRDLGSRKAVV